MNCRVAIVALATFTVLSQLAGALFFAPLPIGPSTALHTIFPKLLLWNASASAPRGLYALRPMQPLRIGMLVVVTPPDPLARFAAARGYLPLGVPLLKHIAALHGQTVCRLVNRVTIDGHVAALTRERDTRGRPLPRWQGCRTLRAGEVLLLNAAVPDSFDGRYFGVLSATTITALAEPLWIVSED